MMIAAEMAGIQNVRLVKRSRPEIGDHELLLRVKRAGICGTDLRMIRNGVPGVSEETPRVLGHEMSGIIEAVGTRVSGYAPGDHVAVAPNMGCGICDRCVRGDTHLCPDYRALGVQLDGAFAEYVRIPEQAVRSGNVAILPEGVSFEAAVLAEPLSCVYNGILQCPIRLGDDVLILGAGTIGILYAQLARRAGAGRVFLANRSLGRLELANTIDPALLTIPVADLEMRIGELTGGRGVDVCVTANPSPESQRQAVELSALNGRINFFGGLPKASEQVSLNTNAIHYKQLMVTGSTKANTAHFRQTLQFLASGLIDAAPLISQTYSIDQFDEALAHAMSSQGIKTLISFD
ncbi:alcohol dehydrogenase catalytic domain-containing protein [Paenibacillus daejeonensis]|uniref:alcohol dehydrogenase catalytic domain-containing protein n=1 Tax=Paenibacillus daejeonensis TaxID=135193 RepID=UPI000364B296|nr:alcohol dehydrogenase catalytic domain-containing protein [Paenibacillus daejeonensis]